MTVQRTIWRWLTILCLAVASLMGTASAAEVPMEDIYVYDYADVIDGAVEREIQRSSTRLKKRTGARITVATVKTIGDTPIEQYSIENLHTWGISEEEKNSTILILFIANAHQSYVVVGSELEGTFNDARKEEIQNQYMIPSFREGDYSQGIWYGYSVVFKETLQAYGIEPGDWNKKSPQKIASSVPTKDIYVQDYANIIDAKTERQMQKYSARLDGRTGAQIVVVTVDTTGDVPIEQYSLELFRKWGIGGKEKNNGVLLLVAVKDRKSRIEVGYGLEGALNDAKTGAIQDEYILPAFQQERYSEGIWRGYAALFKETAKEYQVPIEELTDERRTREDQRPIELGWQEAAMAGVIIILMLIDMKVTGGRFTHIFIRILLFVLSRGRGGFGGGRGGGGGSSRSW